MFSTFSFITTPSGTQEQEGFGLYVLHRVVLHSPQWNAVWGYMFQGLSKHEQTLKSSGDNSTPETLFLNTKKPSNPNLKTYQPLKIIENNHCI